MLRALCGPPGQVAERRGLQEAPPQPLRPATGTAMRAGGTERAEGGSQIKAGGTQRQAVGSRVDLGSGVILTRESEARGKQ